MSAGWAGRHTAPRARVALCRRVRRRGAVRAGQLASVAVNLIPAVLIVAAHTLTGHRLGLFDGFPSYALGVAPRLR